MRYAIGGSHRRRQRLNSVGGWGRRAEERSNGLETGRVAERQAERRASRGLKPPHQRRKIALGGFFETLENQRQGGQPAQAGEGFLIPSVRSGIAQAEVFFGLDQRVEVLHIRCLAQAQ